MQLSMKDFYIALESRLYEFSIRVYGYIPVDFLRCRVKSASKLHYIQYTHVGGVDRGRVCRRYC